MKLENSWYPKIISNFVGSNWGCILVSLSLFWIILGSMRFPKKSYAKEKSFATFLPLRGQSEPLCPPSLPCSLLTRRPYRSTSGVASVTRACSRWISWFFKKTVTKATQYPISMTRKIACLLIWWHWIYISALAAWRAPESVINSVISARTLPSPTGLFTDEHKIQTLILAF